MFRSWDHRLGHYAVLLFTAAALFLPNLGLPSLWDIDEGHNAEAAWEMLESGNWVVPTFNFQLRVDKPALLYWLQIAAYQRFGVNEFAARLPSALAAALTLLLTYELGRLLFGARVGLLAGLILASSILFCAAAHFANPDALLGAATTLTFLFLWLSMGELRRQWLLAAGVSSGLAVLAKGPVGLVLPAAALGLFLLWSRRLRSLWCWSLAGGILLFIVTALPWYVWVGVDTKVDFLKGFFLTHNVGRFLQPMESHSGPVFYYLLVLLVGFAPWSILLGLVFWYTIREERAGSTSTPAHGQRQILAVRFLLSWAVVYLIFFSLSRTKLPNYILPIYPAVALLTGRFFERWRQGEIQLPRWALPTSFAGMILVGLVTSGGLLWTGGVIDIPGVKGQRFPGLECWAMLGMLPILGAVLAYWCWRRHSAGGVVLSFLASAVFFAGTLAAFGGGALEAHKAPRSLLQALPTGHDELEIRVACYQYYQPSLVFYCQRELSRLKDEAEVREFLTHPLPVYLFVTASAWESLQLKIEGPHMVLARAYDLYRKCEVVVVTNQGTSQK